MPRPTYSVLMPSFSSEHAAVKNMEAAAAMGYVIMPPIIREGRGTDNVPFWYFEARKEVKPGKEKFR